MFDFRLLDIHYYHRKRTFHFWIGLVGFTESGNGWLLLGISINDLAKFTLTLFNYNFNLGKLAEAN